MSIGLLLGYTLGSGFEHIGQILAMKNMIAQNDMGTQSLPGPSLVDMNVLRKPL